MKYDPKSDYYAAGGIQTIDFIRAKLTPEEFRGYLKGNILRYVSRPGKGDPARDAEKLAYYAGWLAEEMGGPDAKRI